MYVYEKKYFFALENCKKLNQEKRFKINVLQTFYITKSNFSNDFKTKQQNVFMYIPDLLVTS